MITLDKTTPEYIKYVLVNNPKAVDRAIVAIYHRQTLDEQLESDTKHSNGVGFSGSDARVGTYFAKWILSGNKLSGKHLVKATTIAHKYVRQLCEIAKENFEKDSVFANEERNSIQENA
jgi:hypothetical protein